MIARNCSRALTIAQDSAYRDKRLALGRALAAAAEDTGTKVDNELLFIRVLADLDEPHIRCLRTMANAPKRHDPYHQQLAKVSGEAPGCQ